ncbi:MAG: bis(5'-nucleosyl)-tetraphosphatase (symmetrical) YqeK [Anaerolineae bacterium]|nr:bis(5'-nucleosyl)-tetraphosphatase (symmetrical) YqeK [Anaerolineae bacterium]
MPELSGDIPADVTRFLVARGCAATAAHCRAVAEAAVALATRFGVRADAAQAAGWLHDVSAVVPVTGRVAVAEAWGLEVLPEEAALPMILHQKLSAWMAQHYFGISDPSVIGAIGCHTTLRAGATPLDMVVFVADKIAWDQPGTPPYLAALEAALHRSLVAGACVYLSYLWQHRADLPVVHPWLAQAYGELCQSPLQPGARVAAGDQV